MIISSINTQCQEEGIQGDRILGFYGFQISNIIEGGDTPIIEAVDLSNYTSPTNATLFELI